MVSVLNAKNILEVTVWNVKQINAQFVLSQVSQFMRTEHAKNVTSLAKFAMVRIALDAKTKVIH